MDDGSALLIILLLLLLSAFFSGSETAFFSLPRLYLKKLEKSKSSSAKRILKLLSRPRQLLITILLGNTFVNMGISSLGALLAIGIAQKHKFNTSTALTIQVIITTIVIVLFGEIIPKLTALATANKFAQIASLPLQFFSYLFYVPVWLIDKFNLLLSRKKPVDRHMTEKVTTEEIHNLIQSESSKHTLDEDEKKMLVGLFRFKDAKITEIYVPRVKVRAIEENSSLEELKELIVSTGYSRIPVYRKTIDEIVGIIYVKDLILYPEKKTIRELMRPAWFVTENMKVQTLLNQFKQKKMQMAIVVDEYGGTSGIISLEDILEEIVGEIQDEYDQYEVPELSQIDENTYRMQGIVSIRLFNEELDAALDAEEYDNIAEFLLSQFNHVPAPGETLIWEDTLQFKVLDSDNKSIKLIEVIKLPKES
ncbi:MAG TPA: hemolysin family protein [Candidatus Syntrophosphaera sp.]|nr:HlyC/CorC family transporter [Candidatus Syntrophosphaera sp.]OQB07486.1 MAG: Magnesium and cobalt efflux protein CorC [Candidatus Cloacimonetes bacterium ADurb.Bin211]HOD59244.1 hemolysin family protein [Candidatus Syntrophosphaera sp.]